MPWALTYGVPYNLFWHLNPTKLEPFRIAYENKIKMRDYENWQLGRYVHQAYISCWNKDAKYPEKPFSQMDNTEQIQVDEDGNEILTEKQAEQARERLVMRLEIMEGRKRREEMRRKRQLEREQKGIGQE